MKKTSFVGLIAITMFLVTGNVFAYELNGKSYNMDVFLKNASKSVPVVSVQTKETPLVILLEDILKQSGTKVKWWGFENEAPHITIQSKEAPVLHVLAEIAKTYKLDLYRNNESEDTIFLAKENAVLTYAVNGPALVTWHGKITSADFDFTQSPPAPVEVTKYRMRFLRDLGSTLQTYDPNGGTLHRNRPVRFILSSGGERTLQSDHAPNTFGGPWQDWQFEPVKEFEGKKADLIVTLPISISDTNHKVSQKEIEFVLKDCPV